MESLFKDIGMMVLGAVLSSAVLIYVLNRRRERLQLRVEVYPPRSLFDPPKVPVLYLKVFKEGSEVYRINRVRLRFFVAGLKLDVEPKLKRREFEPAIGALDDPPWEVVRGKPLEFEIADLWKPAQYLVGEGLRDPVLFVVEVVDTEDKVYTSEVNTFDSQAMLRRLPFHPEPGCPELRSWPHDW